MKSCCVEQGNTYFAHEYPLDVLLGEDSLAAHVIDLCKKWGEMTKTIVGNVFIRTTTSLKLGVNAKTGALKCNVCNDPMDYIFIGARLLSFVWRINMTCATYWGKVQKSETNNYVMSGSVQWPREEQLEQVRIALEMYFGNSPLFGTEGLVDLNRQIFNLTIGPSVEHLYTVDFAELFVLFHEIQHHLPSSHLERMPIPFQVQLPSHLEISPKRRSWWITELDNDVNSLCLLFLSAASVFIEKFNMDPPDAKTQAASLVCAGADAALHSLQILEELRYGKVTLQAAATGGEFVHHPPSAFRRNVLSCISYSLVTGKSSDSLFRREFTDSWKIVAQNVQSHMELLDGLFAAYKAWDGRSGMRASVGGC